MNQPEDITDMAHKSKRRRRKKKHGIIVMNLKEGTTNRQECPVCPAVIIDSPIPNRICWKCSPQESAKQLRNAFFPDKEKDEKKPKDPVSENKISEAYNRTEAYLRKWHDDNGMKVPDCFTYSSWSIYFFSRGSMLREWSRCLNSWMKDECCKPVTDMTPGHELERKIKERREASGTPGPGFRTVEDKVANLRGELERVSTGSQGRYSSQVHTPTRGVQQVAHKAPSIAGPIGEGGTEFLVI